MMIVKIEVEIKDELADFIKPAPELIKMVNYNVSKKLIKYADNIKIVWDE